MRRYEEFVQVVEAVRGGGPRGAAPESFVWRGRCYAVRAVLDRWVERRPWWRTVLDPPTPIHVAVPTRVRGAGAGADPSAGAVAGAGHDSSGRLDPALLAATGERSGGLALAELEDEVWRVEAAAGASRPVGIYDIARRVTGAGGPADDAGLSTIPGETPRDVPGDTPGTAFGDGAVTWWLLRVSD